MKRDFDLIRRILRLLEDDPHGYAPEVVIEGYSEEEIGYHCYLIDREGLAEGLDASHMGSESPCYLLTSLTPAGHDFLEASRDEERWTQAKSIAAKVKGLTLDVLTNVLSNLLMQQVTRML